MSVSTRHFLRDFPKYRKLAEKGDTVVIQTREGTKFIFHQIGQAPRPRRVEKPLPHKITDKWNVESPATEPGDWEMNR